MAKTHNDDFANLGGMDLGELDPDKVAREFNDFIACNREQEDKAEERRNQIASEMIAPMADRFKDLGLTMDHIDPDVIREFHDAEEKRQEEDNKNTSDDDGPYGTTRQAHHYYKNIETRKAPFFGGSVGDTRSGAQSSPSRASINLSDGRTRVIAEADGLRTRDWTRSTFIESFVMPRNSTHFLIDCTYVLPFGSASAWGVFSNSVAQLDHHLQAFNASKSTGIISRQFVEREENWWIGFVVRPLRFPNREIYNFVKGTAKPGDRIVVSSDLFGRASVPGGGHARITTSTNLSSIRFMTD